ncbi:MAG TPA: PP2C family protein-serine/threonine phosphatase, partial [Thermoanaerobaculia bacterium]
IFVMLVLAFPFIKRYHEGEIGVRRGAQILLLVAVSALLYVLLVARSVSQGDSFGFASREQTTWIAGLGAVMFQILPTCLLAFFAWSVGESVCRERWGPKLAAFDALFHGDWSNATVARSALRGAAAGCALAGAFVALLVALRHLGASPLTTVIMPGSSDWPGLGLAMRWLASSFPGFLAVMLCLVPMVSQRLGRAAGTLAGVLLGGVLLFPTLVAVPFFWGMVASMAFAVLPVLMFLAYDLLTVLMAGAIAESLVFGWPLLRADDASLRVNGALALVILAAPLLASIAALRSRREFVYRYVDIPPHVRRIAERERQRVELETARRIQSSILPELPPRLQGVEIAHAYLPASEVGGDFYDVLALEDGRLAVAVGDVAGHGVSSGLVMSMAKSALAVQVTFDPEIQAVFTTLNRMVHQTARKRLLATLCYLLLDPRRRELVYASAGHLFPYRVTPGGRVQALESIAYPLGVRNYLTVEPKTASLDPGDTLFLFSDGLVEAKSSHSEEMYGFERLEESLARHAEHGVEVLRDGVLADLARFTGNQPREDDQTLLVLRLP